MKLDPDQVKELLESGKDVVFLDVRQPDLIRKKGTLQGAVNIPFAELDQRAGELPKHKPIITACNGGGSAGRAAKLLEEKGYTVAGSCGVDPWIEKGYPVVRGKE